MHDGVRRVVLAADDDVIVTAVPAASATAAPSHAPVGLLGRTALSRLVRGVAIVLFALDAAVTLHDRAVLGIPAGFTATAAPAAPATAAPDSPVDLYLVRARLILARLVSVVTVVEHVGYHRLRGRWEEHGCRRIQYRRPCR
jgi:hypothetical protein